MFSNLPPFGLIQLQTFGGVYSSVLVIAEAPSVLGAHADTAHNRLSLHDASAVGHPPYACPGGSRWNSLRSSEAGDVARTASDPDRRARWTPREVRVKSARSDRRSFRRSGRSCWNRGGPAGSHREGLMKIGKRLPILVAAAA